MFLLKVNINVPVYQNHSLLLKEFNDKKIAVSHEGSKVSTKHVIVFANISHCDINVYLET